MNNIVVGLVLVGMGALLLLDQWGLVDFWWIVSRWWPAALVLAGGWQLWRGSRLGGALVAIFGLLLLGRQLEFVEPQSLTAFWPLALVAIGAVVLSQGAASRRTNSGGHSAANMVALFDDHKLVLRRPFARGQAFTLFGDAHLDLSEAEPTSGESVVEVFLIFGDFEVTVPSDWEVENRSVALFGATQPASAKGSGSAAHVVAVRGLQVFGDVIIRRRLT